MIVERQKKNIAFLFFLLISRQCLHFEFFLFSNKNNSVGDILHTSGS